MDVKVTIELSKPVGGTGFGCPLLLTSGAEKAVAYTECYSLEDVVAAGFAEESDIYKAANALFMQENRPEKIAVCASAEEALKTAITAVIDKDWRQLVVVGVDSTEYLAAAEYIEAYKKQMFVSMDKSAFTTFKGTLEGKKLKRFIIFVNGSANANAALVGETAGRPAGSFTYKFKTLKGVEAETFTEAELEAFHKAGAFAYVTRAGDDITTEGIAQDGTYIDQTDAIDYVVQNVTYRNQKVLNRTAKVPYDNRGIALHECATLDALQEAAVNGIIATKDDGSYDYSVYFAPRSQTTEADRASRVYKYGSFRFALAGAIHKCEVRGEITY